MSNVRSPTRKPPLAQPSLFDAPATPVNPPGPPDPDAASRAYAVDPRHNVVLEASAGTGKTSVLVARYVNLLAAGVDPSNILAITFTRKAAAEMRERIIRELREAADRSALDRRRWLELRDRLSDVAISTIDAFCLSLLREFPLEADVDPAFDLADETEIPRLMVTALDRTLRILVGLARSDGDVALVLAQLGIARTREGLATLLDRRLVAWSALERFLVRGPRDLTAESVCRAAVRALHDVLQSIPGGLAAFLADGPSRHPRYALLRREIQALDGIRDASAATIRAVLDRITAHFLTTEGKARKAGAVPPYRPEHYPNKDATKRHRELLFQIAPLVEQTMFAFNRDLNVVLARGIRRMYGIALEQYRQALDERSVLDFSDVLERALELLRRMDEFSQSRFRLESRYHHVLVDEFQDTSRAQWELVSLLVQTWSEGQGLAANPSIFIVGDRKQSIYRFRDAEVGVLEEAAHYIGGLRPGGGSRRSIVRSFRAVPELLHFVNDVFSEISVPRGAGGEFTYDDRDRFPVPVADPAGRASAVPALGIAVADTADASAVAVADEIARLLHDATVRDKSTGVARPARPGDIAILFRSRTSHREFERELGLRGIPTYVYKGLGFFDADEIKDLIALLRYLADPTSALRAAALLRSRFIRISDRSLAVLAPDLADALLGEIDASTWSALDPEDRPVLEHARTHVRRWLAEVDRITPADLLDQILDESAYAYEIRGVRRRQAWENIKKMRGLVRRIQNRGYATLRRIAEHLMALSAGDESNAVIEALDAVNLMTVHAAKGLEFPIVFVVNLARGANGPHRPVRVIADARVGDDGEAVPSVTVGPFLSDTDEAERERERHETRRLLYVALTRARDRLYLSSPVKDGVLVPGRGSLAEVLPESLKFLFGRVSSAFAELETLGWTGSSGHEYTWRLCRVAQSESGRALEGPASRVESAPMNDDVDPPAFRPSRMRVAVTALERESLDPATPSQQPQSDTTLGTLLHRLFQFAHQLDDPTDRAALAALAARGLRTDELAAIDDVPRAASMAADGYLSAQNRPDIVEAFNGVERLYEVPFSLLITDGETDRIVRGTIDCLVRKEDGSITVVELKTGAPRAAHQRQLDVYVRAAQALCGVDRVTGALLYL